MGIIDEFDISTAETLSFMIENNISSLQEAYKKMDMPFDLRMSNTDEFRQRIKDLSENFVKD